MIDEWANGIRGGDAVEKLRQLPELSVHMAMCSPPCYGLQDYGDGTITVFTDGGDASGD